MIARCMDCEGISSGLARIRTIDCPKCGSYDTLKQVSLAALPPLWERLVKVQEAIRATSEDLRDADLPKTAARLNWFAAELGDILGEMERMR